ncbi:MULTISPECIES: hypothetical protein [unclassified Microbacterium]|uniref:hypothetical protein n=1 Tax=unclassified Microbacterium TaxID=2609290 RepID=UPI00214B0C67|nr:MULTISPECIES: hypothetical protein [unclassified Microbacterium]MCR2810790.1 hypothetical protein [Microbacterium sp. zg.B185]WIM18322.1 hypothetical protein QNO12_12005 [Microbacterium sp. zg-B185]
MPVPAQTRHVQTRHVQTSHVQKRLVPARATRGVMAIALACVLAALAVIAAPAPAHAAAPGAGFGTWAPLSPYGWHGSMVIDGVHTYCILPGAPAPTGTSVDHGVSGSAVGLSPQQLTGINLLVTKYGQTGDPVQAAAVGWAVKAIANWDETLHHFGYRGDSLAGAIHWTFSALAPEQNESVQNLAVAYYEEGRSTPPGAAAASGALIFTTDAAEPALGSVRVDASTPAARGTLTLANATFADTGTSTLPNAAPGRDYAITAQPPAPGRPYVVTGSGRFVVQDVAAVRHFTTAGGQDTAGPAGEVGFDVSGEDAAPRVPLFAPTVSTQVASKYVAAGSFIDAIVFGGSVEHWPRSPDGGFLPVTAAGTVYRTESVPARAEAGVPTDAVAVGTLALTTDERGGPTTSYTVISGWALPGPGVYTAVWTVDRGAQTEAVAGHLRADYTWTESFGETTQIAMVPAVSSLAEPTVTAESPLTDTVIVGSPLPAEGLLVSSAVYLAPDGTAPAEVCTPSNLVWASDPHLMTAPGEHTVTSPVPGQPGTYFWQERAMDAAGEVVHLGECGTPSETTRVLAPAAADSAQQAPALAATGLATDRSHAIGAIAVGCLTAGATSLTLSRRRRLASPIG